MRRHRRFLLVLVALAGMLAGGAHAREQGGSDPAQTARLVLSLANEFRTQEGRGPLVVNGRLEEAARHFALYLAKTGRFSHGADGTTPVARARGGGYDDCIVAENIAYQFSSTGFATRALAQGFVESWKQSSGHRRNLLDPDVTETGIAVARGGKAGEYYAVQMLGRPASQSIKFSLANRSSAAVRYRLGGKTFSLAPRQVRTHTQCRSEELQFDWSGRQEATVLMPRGAADYAIVRSDQRGFAVRAE